MIMKMWTVPSTSERASLPWVTPGSSLAPHGSPVQPDTLATHIGSTKYGTNIVQMLDNMWRKIRPTSGRKVGTNNGTKMI